MNNKTDFTTQVFHINGMGEIQSMSLREFATEFAEETTSPRGAEPIIHIRNGLELWTWGARGQNPRQLQAFNSEAEAERQLLEWHLDSCSERGIFPIDTMNEALEILADTTF